MRLLPRSLFGRLVLILIVGLILAQILGSLLLLRDRERILQQRLGLNMIQRISGVVKLVEKLPGADREHLVQALETPGSQVEISDRPETTGEDAIPAPHLEAMLRQQLPGYEHMIVSVVPMPTNGAFRRPVRTEHRHPMMPWRGRPPKHSGFHFQVKLSDGNWIGFRRLIPDRILTWPVRMLGYLVILVISIIILSLLAVRLVTRPLGVLARAADGLGRDIQSPPLEESGPSEVSRAARAFNTMQRRLRRYIEDRGQILAAISHDLKTPITRLRLRTEMLPEPELKENFVRDLNEMEQMVSATLDFMRGTDSREKPVPIDIMALLEALAGDMRELGAKVTLETADLSPFTGRPLALKRCIGNLLENAVRYGQEAHIRIQDTPSQLQIIISDQGPGIPDEELEGLFRPFYRRETSRNRQTGGTGLGLGIARNIARAHGGEVTLRPGSSAGLEAIVTLPRDL